MKSFVLKSLLPAFFILLCFFAGLYSSSCSSSVSPLEILEGDFTVPKIEDMNVTGADTLELTFSKEASVTDGKIYGSDGSIIDAVAANDGLSVQVNLSDKTSIGGDYVYEGSVEDKTGNTLSFSIPFVGYNDHPARLLLSEVRTESESGGKMRHEFVEVYVLKGGNLAGFEILSACDGESKKYSFPSIEVEKGDYITVHMKRASYKGNEAPGMESETGSDLGLATHADSSPSRDLWSDVTSSVLGKNDCIMIRSSYDGSVSDAFVYCLSTFKGWTSAQSSLMAKASSVWTEGFSRDAAFCTDEVKTSATRSLSRQNIGVLQSEFDRGIYDGKPIPNSKADWILTATGKVTPGLPNSSEAYVPKS